MTAITVVLSFVFCFFVFSFVVFVVVVFLFGLFVFKFHFNLYLRSIWSRNRVKNYCVPILVHFCRLDP